MSFAEHRVALDERLRQLEDLLRQAQGVGRTLEDQVGTLDGATESFADDTLLAQIGATARRVRQESGALMRVVATTRGQLHGSPGDPFAGGPL